MERGSYMVAGDLSQWGGALGRRLIEGGKRGREGRTTNPAVSKSRDSRFGLSGFGLAGCCAAFLSFSSTHSILFLYLKHVRNIRNSFKELGVYYGTPIVRLPKPLKLSGLEILPRQISLARSFLGSRTYKFSLLLHSSHSLSGSLLRTEALIRCRRRTLVSPHPFAAARRPVHPFAVRTPEPDSSCFLCDLSALLCTRYFHSFQLKGIEAYIYLIGPLSA
ncbi:hypothetical protein MA16_Dca011759 [Dendrobium catenatum]|uniref:Uncharacterized protein n=1 Tax=Dendrobium catenatum TaxID=906689 RepID=A0A2I0WEF8_9ASPA|nr:hypothetical protein MA16_Dca011759 [Dendrobium catenatum]